MGLPYLVMRTCTGAKLITCYYGIQYAPISATMPAGVQGNNIPLICRLTFSQLLKKGNNFTSCNTSTAINKIKMDLIRQPISLQ
jgi:hypothetical protein